MTSICSVALAHITACRVRCCPPTLIHHCIDLSTSSPAFRHGLPPSGEPAERSGVRLSIPSRARRAPRGQLCAADCRAALEDCRLRLSSCFGGGRGRVPCHSSPVPRCCWRSAVGKVPASQAGSWHPVKGNRYSRLPAQASALLLTAVLKDRSVTPLRIVQVQTVVQSAPTPMRTKQRANT